MQVTVDTFEWFAADAVKFKALFNRDVPAPGNTAVTAFFARLQVPTY